MYKWLKIHLYMFAVLPKTSERIPLYITPSIYKEGKSMKIISNATGIWEKHYKYQEIINDTKYVKF